MPQKRGPERKVKFQVSVPEDLAANIRFTALLNHKSVAAWLYDLVEKNAVTIPKLKS